MAIDVADLVVNLSTDLSGLDRGLSDAQRLVEKASDAIGNEGDRAGESFGQKFTDQFARFGIKAGEVVSAGLSNALGDMDTVDGVDASVEIAKNLLSSGFGAPALPAKTQDSTSLYPGSMPVEPFAYQMPPITQQENAFHFGNQFSTERGPGLVDSSGPVPINNVRSSQPPATQEMAGDAAGLHKDIEEVAQLIEKDMAPGFEKIATEFHAIGDDARQATPLIVATAEAAGKLADNTGKTGDALGAIKATAGGMHEILDDVGLTMEGVGSVFETSFQKAFTHVTNGWQSFLTSFAQSFAQTIQKMAEQYLSSQLASILFGGNGAGSEDGPASPGGAGIISFLGGMFQGLFADGGDFTGGKAMIVGENGPELLVPRGSGSVIPNDQLAGMTDGPTIINMNLHVPSIEAAGTRETQAQVARAYKLTLMKESFRT